MFWTIRSPLLVFIDRAVFGISASRLYLNLQLGIKHRRFSAYCYNPAGCPLYLGLPVEKIFIKGALKQKAMAGAMSKSDQHESKPFDFGQTAWLGTDGLRRGHWTFGSLGSEFLEANPINPSMELVSCETITAENHRPNRPVWDQFDLALTRVEPTIISIILFFILISFLRLININIRSSQL